MSDIENSDLYDGGSLDAPLIDSLGSAVKRLIDKGRARGFITVEELNKVLPSERETSEHIEDIMTSISDMGISIISEADADGFDGETDSESDYIDDDEEGGNFDEKDLGRNDDPVRMYLKEMGSVELLSREGEIAIAKRIEAGKTVMIDGLCESPMTISAIASWRDELLNGNMQLRDIIDLEMMYGDDVEAMAFEEDDNSGNEDLDKVARELDEKENLDDIDDDIDDDMELEGAVDEEDDPADEMQEDGDVDGEGGDDEDMENGSVRTSASIAAMEEALKEPVVEMLNKIAGYYDDLRKIQNQRVKAIIEGKSLTPSVEKKYIEVKKDLVELMSSIHLNAIKVEQLVEQLNSLNKRLMGFEGKLLRYAMSCKIKREDFLAVYQKAELDPNWLDTVAKIKDKHWQEFVSKYGLEITECYFAPEQFLGENEYPLLENFAKKGKKKGLDEKFPCQKWSYLH